MANMSIGRPLGRPSHPSSTNAALAAAGRLFAALTHLTGTQSGSCQDHFAALSTFRQPSLTRKAVIE
jgi:hypothetical protein